MNTPTNITETATDYLYEIEDPEIGINIIDLGLVYELGYNKQQNRIELLITLTSPACPFTETLTKQITQKLTPLTGNPPKIVWTFTPAWGPRKMTAAGLEQLRTLGAQIPIY